MTAYVEGRLSEDMLEILFGHLAVCSECYRSIMLQSKRNARTSRKGEVKGLGKGQRRYSTQVYSAILDRVFREIADENQEAADAREKAPALFAELAEFSVSQQKLLIRNSRRYNVWALATEFLSRSRDGWTEDPTRSETLAEFALEIANQLRFTGFRESLLNDLKAEAWSYIANCRRIKTDYFSAEQAFREAERYLAKGSGDQLERARLLDLKASFYGARKEYETANQILEEVIRVYRAAGDRHMEARVLMNQAKFLRESGTVRAAIPLLELADSLMDAKGEPWLYFMLKRNMVIHLVEAGRLEEAQRLLPQVRELARDHGTRLERLRLFWTEAIVRQGLGQSELAIELLSQAREGFVAAGIGYDVALASLDLAGLYLGTGRTKKARELATESIPLFTSRGVHREALKAWNLFQEAAERDALTVGLVQEVASRIRRSQSRPASGDLP